jgi:hypothetical protein
MAGGARVYPPLLPVLKKEARNFRMKESNANAA